MKNFQVFVLAALLMAAPHAANAQTPGPPATGTTGAVDASSVTNAPTATTTATDTTVTTTTGISPDASIEAIPLEGEGTLADTGGAPIAMTLSGLAMALGAFGLRRKLGS